MRFRSELILAVWIACTLNSTPSDWLPGRSSRVCRLSFTLGPHAMVLPPPKMYREFCGSDGVAAAPLLMLMPVT